MLTMRKLANFFDISDSMFFLPNPVASVNAWLYCVAVKEYCMVVLTVAFLAGCGRFQKKEEPKEEKRPSVVVVGEVSSVHPKQGFVLFRRYSSGLLVTEGLLSSRSPDGQRAASLTLSPEKLGRFYTADYDVEGPSPREGDLVLLSKLVEEEKEEALSEVPES